MADKKAVALDKLGIVKNYIDRKDAESIKSAEFVDDTIKLYASSDKSGEAVAEIALPDETFLDGEKTRLVSDFSWSITEYPKSVDPELDGKTVLVLGVKSRRTVRYSFVSLDSVITKLVGGETESASVSVSDDVVALNVRVSKEADNSVVMKSDGLYVGVVDNTPTWTVSTDDEVSEMFSISGYGAGTLGAKNVGDIVKIEENGAAANYIVVHKGLPSDMYDNSCDGVWLLREQTQSQRAWNTPYNNDYEKSTINQYLNSVYFNSIDSNVSTKIKEVKIPYKKGKGTDSAPVLIGENGLQCRVFLLSSDEVGLSAVSYVAQLGTKLDFFIEGYDDASASEKRMLPAGSPGYGLWWLRSPAIKNTEGDGDESVGAVLATLGKGASHYWTTDGRLNVRPAFILPYDIPVNADGLITG